MQTPIVLSIHGSDLAYTIHQKPFGAYIIPRILQKADAVLANSAATAQGLRQAGVAQERLHIVRLGANPPPLYLTQQKSSSTETVQILSVGYLNLQKGHIYLLQALSDLKQQGYNFHYTIVGDGPAEQSLKQFVQQSGMSSHEFTMSLLEKERVAVSPGDTFGQHGKDYIRICFAVSEDNLKEALNRICRHVRRNA
jgi:aspartate/methionine/tyrosine aminotransferase